MPCSWQLGLGKRRKTLHFSSTMLPTPSPNRTHMYIVITKYLFTVGSETWPVRKENEVALQRAEMRMVRWMCNVKVKDRASSKELRERLEIDDIILILQQNRLRWYGHALRKEDTDWVKKCMEYEVEGSRPRGRPKRTWREVVQKDCQACNLKWLLCVLL